MNVLEAEMKNSTRQKEMREELGRKDVEVISPRWLERQNPEVNVENGRINMEDEKTKKKKVFERRRITEKYLLKEKDSQQELEDVIPYCSTWAMEMLRELERVAAAGTGSSQQEGQDVGEREDARRMEEQGREELNNWRKRPVRKPIHVKNWLVDESSTHSLSTFCGGEPGGSRGLDRGRKGEKSTSQEEAEEEKEDREDGGSCISNYAHNRSRSDQRRYY